MNVNDDTSKNYVSVAEMLLERLKVNKSTLKAGKPSVEPTYDSSLSKTAGFSSVVNVISPSIKKRKAKYRLSDSTEFQISDSKMDSVKIKKMTRHRMKQNDILLAINALSISRSSNTMKNEKFTQSKQIEKATTNIPLHLKVDLQLKYPDLSSASTETDRFKAHIYDMNYNRTTFKKVNILKYRENVFRAASKLTKEMPSYPDWVYRSDNSAFSDTIKINVGGQIFFVMEETLVGLNHMKLSKCILEHQSEGIPFFDRDYICFTAILNFFRTGRLHAPPNTCLSLFEDELEFWGVSDQYMEQCCWTDYNMFKTASTVLKKYGEDIDRDEDFKLYNQTALLNWRIKLYKLMTLGKGTIMARWVSTICSVFIIMSIVSMIVSSTPSGRVSVKSRILTYYRDKETVSSFFSRTMTAPGLQLLENSMSGFFLSELIIRLILCSNRLEFFSDTLNWVDLLATITTLFSNILTKESTPGGYQGYMLLLKMPRIFRLFKLTSALRSGMDAFILTIIASANELRLILILIFIMTAVFGCTIFVVEMANEQNISGSQSDFKNVYLGMWWAMVTMTTVGFGDLIPRTTMGYLCGFVVIITGVLICQFPVPIVLKNFAIYNNQANARLNHKVRFWVDCTDPENTVNLNQGYRLSMKKTSGQTLFTKMFSNLK